MYIILATKSFKDFNRNPKQQNTSTIHKTTWDIYLMQWEVTKYLKFSIYPQLGRFYVTRWGLLSSDTAYMIHVNHSTENV